MRKTSGHGYESCGVAPKRSPAHQSNEQRKREDAAWKDFCARKGIRHGRWSNLSLEAAE